MAHYDSVPAGPGASDDGAGVAAVLEIARILKAGPPPRHGVLLLIDDGEEAGLLGARAFAEKNPAVDEVGAVVNLEARGSGGPSLMFETSGPDAWLVSRWAAGAPRPFTSSLFSAIYQFMPNDTDLTVFKRRDIPGLNFAFIDGPTHYHTSLDTVANASLGSLQHHGDNALAAVRGLAESNLDAPPQGRAVFFDLFHAAVVRWPAGLSPVLGILALILSIAAAVMAQRRRLATWSSVVLGLLIPLAALVLTLVLALGLQALLAGAFPNPWVARPLPATLAFWLLALAASLGVASLLGRRSNASGLWAGVWIFWSLVGLLLGLFMPGASYLFLVPALIAGLCGLALGGYPGGRMAASILPVFVAGLLWFPILRALYLGLGLLGLVATGVLLSFVFGALAPLVPPSGSFGRRWVPLAAAAAAVLCAVLAMVSPPFSPRAPRPVRVQLYENGGEAPLGGAQHAALPARDAQGGPVRPAAAAPLPMVAADSAVVSRAGSATERGGSRARGARRLGRRRQAPPPAAAHLAAGSLVRHDRRAGGGEGGVGRDRRRGHSPGPRSGSPGPGGAWLALFTNHTVPPQGSEIEIVLGNSQPLDWYVFDRSLGVPPTGQALLAARPKDSVPFQDGDATIVSRKVRI